MIYIQNRTFVFTLLIAAVACLVFSGSTYAQSLPVCSHQYYDADNDGYGWQDEASCIITSATIPPPVYINEQTGGQVELTRVYWDGNTDISNRIIQCDQYNFDANAGSYSQSNDGYINTVFYRHSQLPSVSPFEGWMRLSTDNNFEIAWHIYEPPLWTISDGRYVGPSLLADPYVELTVKDGAKVVRRWFNEGQSLYLLGYDFLENPQNFWDTIQMASDGYIECSDTSGADFAPTGQVGVQTTTPGPSALAQITLSAEIAADDAGQVPDMPADIYNRLTGEGVQLTRAYWDVNTDLIGEFGCTGLSYFEGATNYIAAGAIGTDYKWRPVYSESEGSIDYWTRTEGHGGSRWVSFENGFFSGEVPEIFSYHYVEIIERSDGTKGSRGWNSSDYFVECSIAPTGSAPQSDSSDSEVTNTDTDSGENTSDVNPVVDDNQQVNNPLIQSENTPVGGGAVGLWSLFIFLSLYFFALVKNNWRSGQL